MILRGVPLTVQRQITSSGWTSDMLASAPSACHFHRQLPDVHSDSFSFGLHIHSQIHSHLVHDNSFQELIFLPQTCPSDRSQNGTCPHVFVERPRKQVKAVLLVLLQEAVEKGWFRSSCNPMSSGTNMLAVVCIARQIAEALSCLHSNGIVHGVRKARSIFSPPFMLPDPAQTCICRLVQRHNFSHPRTNLRLPASTVFNPRAGISHDHIGRASGNCTFGAFLKAPFSACTAFQDRVC